MNWIERDRNPGSASTPRSEWTRSTLWEVGVNISLHRRYPYQVDYLRIAQQTIVFCALPAEAGHPPQKKNTNMFHPTNISRGSVLTITLGLPSILFAQICRTASPQTSMLEPAQPQPVAMMLSCWWSSGSGPTTYLSSHCWPLLVGVLAWLIRWFQQPSSWSWNHIHV